MNLSIRHATTFDAALIADMSRQTFSDTFAPDNTNENMDKFLSEQFTKGALMMEVGLKEHTFLLAYADEEAAGYVKLRDGKKPPEIKGTAIEIARLYATKSFIGKGVGRLLMEACIDEARKKEKEIIWLCVWEKNKKAIDFYTAWGFQKFGECDFVLGDDVQHDWMMKKDLTESVF
ncbi:MAG: family N-acetyltransferase [Flavisolibacter sp.]|jgi:GNAT superfamily N-acetyltransferase|nr:family N-acetyltransferase [Flavisolibacter sp.]